MEETRKKAEYRSSIRSKTLIKRALLELMQEKAFESISVSDIVRKADINRGTFYAHFKSPHDVLFKIQDDMFSELTTLLNRYTPDEVMRDPQPIFRQISEFLISDIAYYRMLFKVAGIHEYLSNNKDKIFSYFMSSSLLSQISDKGMRKNLIALIDFWLCGIFDVYYDSVLEKIPLRLDEVPSFCSRVVSLSSKGSLEFLEVFSRP